MKIVQVLPTIAMGDAVSNDAAALKKIICSMGFDTQIYAENIDPRLQRGTAVHFEKMDGLDEKDIIIYHGSVGTDLSYKMKEMGCHVVMRYHNITPPHFFSLYNLTAYELSKKGLEQTKMLADKIEYVLAVSGFNKKDLLEMGYHCPIDVLPVIIPFSDYDIAADDSLIEKYKDGYTNILFVGRVAPNKKQEDVIRIFNFYKKNMNDRSRLFLIGNYEGMEVYKGRLDRYIQTLGVEDVIFSGHIKFSQILAYYKIADLFLCMSEHEGFCVPLVEAMNFHIPIIAYDSCAVGDTLSNGGILVNDKDPVQISLLMEKILSDEKIRGNLAIRQQEVLKKYSYGHVSHTFQKLLHNFIHKENGV